MIPGAGHYRLGLMHRGLTAMVSFFGVAILVFFLMALTHNESFLVFLLATVKTAHSPPLSRFSPARRISTCP